MASKPEVFIDTNVLLDHLLDRQPFADAAHRILGLAECGEARPFAASLSFSNIFYIVSKLKGAADALAHLQRLRKLVHVSSVGEAEVDAALAARTIDFEDHLQYASAKTVPTVTTIITRDTEGFAGSSLEVLSPEQFLHRIATKTSQTE